ncbi:YgaP family membrane protein [Candidatus Nitrospira bockiana]
MTCNVGGIERPIRMVLGLVLLALATFGGLPSGWMIAFYIVGAVALLTGAIGYCPAWMLLGINTCAMKTTKKAA